jgi:signal transduction histidine kinase/DNA-binding response OmpR family regulator
LIDEKVSILVVDDLPDKLLAFRVVLDELDQNLVMVSSGAEALKQVLEHDFAVILLDVNMPDIDGIETAELIRSYKKTAHTPIIFVTAYADEMQTARGYRLGAVDYILSPIVPEILRSKVRVFVELFRMQQRAQALAKAEAARAVAEEATRRSELLSRASSMLSQSLDLEEGMHKLLDIVVPEMADVALLRIGIDEEELGFYRSGGATRPLDSLAGVPASLVHAMNQARSEGEPVQVRLAGADASDATLWPRGMGAARVLPVQSGSGTLGVLVLGGTRPDTVYARADQATINELVSRAGMAFENARLYWNLKREIARTREAEEKLQDANRRKDEFLAMLSHELRNPLAPIRNAVEVVRRVQPTDPRLAWARDVVDRQVTHLATLVDELLDVSRITQGKITLKKEPVELGKVITQSVETVRSLIEAKGHRLSVDVPGTPVWIGGDFGRLAQVIANLLNNAAKYTPEGGEIRLAASTAEGKAVVAVRDNGMGIDPELLPRVFDLFTQGARSLDRSLGGLGVGLTVVQRLVELHQGRVEVSSPGPGHGAQFTVTLPCLSEVGASLSRESAVSEPACANEGRRVLVVDDNVDAAESIAVFLRLDGHEVKSVHDGQEAIASSLVFAPQVVILDIGLPGMDGYQVARKLRELPQTRDALLIALTGYGQKEDAALATQAGFERHFVKPTDPRAIEAAITQYFEDIRTTQPSAKAGLRA